MDKVAENIERIRTQIAHYNPAVIAVTKYFDENQIKKYYEMGFRDFGENRVKDALEKMSRLPEYILKDSRFHFIGHLQTNKAKLAVGKFDLIHSVDSVNLAEKLNDEARKQGIIQKILLQINNAKEPQKSGFYPEVLKESFKKILELKSLHVLGVMNIAPIDCSEEELHHLFKNIKQIHDELECEFKLKLGQISMGMSKDFMIALEEGATMIRLGRVLFE